MAPSKIEQSVLVTGAAGHIGYAVALSFAESGARNLEYPRHILEMHKADDSLKQIELEIRTFLRDRETVASINNDKDLASAARIHQVNQQSRAVTPGQLAAPPTPMVQQQPPVAGDDALRD